MSHSKKNSVLAKSICRLSFLVIFASSAPSFATMTNEELQAKLEQALNEIAQLKAEVKAQQAKEKPPSEPTMSTVASPVASPEQQESQRISVLENQITQLSQHSNSAADTGLPIHGFIDVGLAHSSDQQPNGASISKLDFYLTPSIGGRIKSLVELNFEVSSTGEVGTDLERMQLGYTFSDELTLWLGRFHTPYGYWNTAYHHGAQIQPTILRPQFLDFEDSGGIIPAHNVGLWATGGFKTSDGKFTYDLIIANGPRIVGGILDPNLASDDNHSAMVGANIGYEFNHTLEGLKIGLDWLKGDVNSYDYTNNENKFFNATQNELNMLGTYLVYLPDDWEFLNEYYYFNNKNLIGGSGTHHSWAAYSQLGFHVTTVWTPYVRWEKAKLDQSDNYFYTQESGQSYDRSIIGARYDINPKATLKFELLQTNYNDRDVHDDNEILFQYAVRF